MNTPEGTQTSNQSQSQKWRRSTRASSLVSIILEEVSVSDYQPRKLISYEDSRELLRRQQLISVIRKLKSIWFTVFYLTIVINYFLITTAYYLYKYDFKTGKVFYWFAVTFDIIFLIGIIKNVFIAKRRTSIIDVLLSIPFWFFYQLTQNLHNIDTNFILLRSISLLRMYKVILWLRLRLIKHGVKRRTISRLELLLVFGLMQYYFVCLWFLLSLNEDTDYFNAAQHSLFVNHGLGFKLSNSYYLVEGFALLASNIFIFYLIANLFVFYHERNRRLIRTKVEIKNLLRLNDDDFNVKRIKSYYQVLHTHKKNINQPKFITVVPHSLLSSAFYDINLPALKCSLLFRQCSVSYLRLIGSFMRHEFYTRNETMLTYRQIKEKMIIIVSGVVELISYHDASLIITLGPGTCICEVALLLTLRCNYIMRAKKFVETQVLYRRDFIKTINYYPKQYVKIQKLIKTRIHRRLRRSKQFIQRLKLMSVPTHKHDQNMSEISNMYKVFVKNRYMHFLDEDSRLFLLWEIYITLVALTIVLTYPLFVAFWREFPKNFLLVSILLEIFLLIDVALMFVTRRVKKNLELLQFKELMDYNFSKIKFYLDIFSCFYFEYFAYLFSNTNHYYYLFKLNRCFKIYKLYDLIRKCESYVHNIALLHQVKYILTLVIITYVGAICAYVVACFEPHCSEDSWFLTKLRQEIDDVNLLSEPIFENKVLFALFYSLCKVVRFELHEIYVVNLEDIIVNLFIVTLAIFIIVIYLSDVASINYLTIKSLLRYKNDSEALFEFCRFHEMPPRLQQRLLDYHMLQWNYNCCFDHTTSSIALTREGFERFVYAQYVEWMRAHEMFQYFEEEFVQSLARHCKLYVLPPNDIVTYFGCMNKEMFLLVEGHCVYKHSDGDGYRRFGPNTLIGLCTLCFGLPEIMTVRTFTHCKILSIDGYALQISLRHHPLYNTILKNMNKDNALLEYEFIQMPQMNNHPGQISTDCIRDTLLKPNFINVLKFCKTHNESYSEPFRVLDTLKAAKFLLLPFTISPSGVFIHVWFYLRSCIVLTYALFEPYKLIMPNPEQFIIPTMAMDIFCLVDLYVMMHVAYYGEQGQLVIHPLYTSIFYLQRNFVWDLLLALPHDLFCVVFRGMFCRYLRLIKCLQCYKLFIAINGTKRHYPHYSFWFDLLKYVIVLTILTNGFTCLMIAADCTQDFQQLKCSDESWFKNSIYSNTTDTHHIYLLTSYWATNLMMGLNFGDFMVHAGYNLYLSIAILITGLIFYINLFITVLPYFVHSNFKLIKFQQYKHDLNRFLIRENITKEQYRKINDNVDYYWRRTKDVDYNRLFGSLHTTLLQDVLSFLYEDTLKQVPLFEEMERSFLRILEIVIKPQYILQGQNIININDILDEFYIVHRGVVQVTFPQSDLKMDLSTGSLFGYYNNEFDPMMQVSVTAETNIDLLCIKTNDYYNILKHYTAFSGILKQRSSEYKDFVPNKQSVERILHSEQSLKQQYKLKRIVNDVTLSNRFYDYFDFAIIFASLLNVLVTTLQFLFQTRAKLLYETIVIDVLFIVYVFMNFSRPFYDDYGKLITNRSIIKKRYLSKKKRATFDIGMNIAALVITVCIYPKFLFPGNLYTFSVLRLITLSRIFYIYDYFQRVKYDLNRNFIAYNICLVVITYFLFLHISFCTWCLIVIIDNKFDHSKINMSEFKELFLFILNLNFSVGLVNVHLANMKQILFATYFQPIARLMQIILCAYIVNALWCYMKVRLNFEHYMMELLDYLRCANIHQYQVKKIATYLNKFWKSESAQNFPVLFQKLPTPVVQELKLEIYRPLIKNSYLFSECDDLFTQHLVSLLDRATYYPGDVIVHHCQVDKSMYFIKQGKVDILTINVNHTETVHDILHENEMFGLTQGLFNNIPHHFTFRANTYTEVLILQLDQWDFLLKYFEHSKDIIYKRIKNLHVQLNP